MITLPALKRIVLAFSQCKILIDLAVFLKRHRQRFDHQRRAAIPVEDDILAAHYRQCFASLAEVAQSAAGRNFFATADQRDKRLAEFRTVTEFEAFCAGIFLVQFNKIYDVFLLILAVWQRMTG